jgi:hypothetical protein
MARAAVNVKKLAAVAEKPTMKYLYEVGHGGARSSAIAGIGGRS